MALEFSLSLSDLGAGLSPAFMKPHTRRKVTARRGLLLLQQTGLSKMAHIGWLRKSQGWKRLGEEES